MDEMRLTNHTKELIEQAHFDKKAREKLVTDNLGLIWSIVKRFAGRGVEQEDLFQIGCIGLIKAIDNFDVSFNVKFSTYAVPMITGEIKRFLRDDGMLKVSRSLKENVAKAARTAEEFRVEYKREPTIEEISEKCNVPVEDLVLSYEAAAEVESIYKTIYQSDGNEVCLVDKLEEKKNFGEEVLNKITVKQLLESLRGDEADLIKYRYFDELTQTEIAVKMGISQVQVSRMEKRILKKMRTQLQ
ncbi:MAG: SigB/SigF/SigG family RNA polymerase sigma factor [Lachnospira sp.]